MTIDRLPVRPAMSRFMAPWDTSSWYYMDAAFKPGSRVYSNAEIYVTEVPECLLGCDFVVTYDSATEGFDDKQGVDFYAERRAMIYVVLDGEADPAFLKGFTPTKLTVSTDAGDAYVLYERKYSAGDQVQIDGFSGPGRHLFVVVKPLDEDSTLPVPEVDRLSVAWRHSTPKFKWHVHDAFNLLSDGSQPAGYRCTGDVSVQPYEDDSGRKYLKVGSSSGIALARETLGLDWVEAALTVGTGTVEVSLDDVEVRLTAACAALPDGTAIANEPGGEYLIGFKRFPDQCRCEIWVNCRPAASVASACAAKATFSVHVPGKGIAMFDRLDWKDQTDVPFIDEAWESPLSVSSEP